MKKIIQTLIIVITILVASIIATNLQAQVSYTDDEVSIRMYRGYVYNIYKSYDNGLTWEKTNDYDLTNLQLKYIEIFRDNDGAIYDYVTTGTGNAALSMQEFLDLPRGERLGIPFNFITGRQFVVNGQVGLYFYQKISPNRAILHFAFADRVHHRLAIDFKTPHQAIFFLIN